MCQSGRGVERDAMISALGINFLASAYLGSGPLVSEASVSLRYPSPQYPQSTTTRVSLDPTHITSADGGGVILCANSHHGHRLGHVPDTRLHARVEGVLETVAHPPPSPLVDCASIIPSTAIVRTMRGSGARETSRALWLSWSLRARRR